MDITHELRYQSIEKFEGSPDEVLHTYEIPLRLADGGTWPIGPYISDEFPDRQFICIPESVELES